MQNPDVLIEALRGAEDKLNREAEPRPTKALGERRSEIFDDPATPGRRQPAGRRDDRRVLRLPLPLLQAGAAGAAEPC